MLIEHTAFAVRRPDGGIGEYGVDDVLGDLPDGLSVEAQLALSAALLQVRMQAEIANALWAIVSELRLINERERYRANGE